MILRWVGYKLFFTTTNYFLYFVSPRYYEYVVVDDLVFQKVSNREAISRVVVLGCFSLEGGGIINSPFIGFFSTSSRRTGRKTLDTTREPSKKHLKLLTEE